MAVTAPPRPPRPGDPVDRDELEAIVEALIEEARRRARRRRRVYASAERSSRSSSRPVTVFERSAQPQTASSAFADGRASAGTTSSKLAFISHRRSDCCGGGGPFELYVMNADGSGKRRLTPTRAGGLAWSPDGQKIAFDGGATGTIDISSSTPTGADSGD